MKSSPALFLVLILSVLPLSLAAQPKKVYGFIITVVDPNNNGIGGVTITGRKIAPSEAKTGLIHINLPEGKTPLVLHHSDFYDKTVEVITSTIPDDNRLTFELRPRPKPVTVAPVPAPSKKVVLRGTVSSLTGSSAQPVPQVAVELFVAGKRERKETDRDGQFYFEIDESEMGDHRGKLEYSHPDYGSTNHIVFDLQKELIRDFYLLLQKQPEVVQEKKVVDFIVRTYKWDATSFRVLDVDKCDCITPEPYGFKVVVPSKVGNVKAKVIMRGHNDLLVERSFSELWDQKNTEELRLVEWEPRQVARVNLKVSGQYSPTNQRIFDSPGAFVGEFIWHPNISIGARKNRIGFVAGVTTKQELHISNSYETLNGFFGTVKNDYILTTAGFVGLRYYFKDFLKQNSTFFVQPEIHFLNQSPKELFSAENVNAEIKESNFLMPRISLGLRRQLLPVLSIEGMFSISAFRIRSESFKFNYFGSADSATETDWLVHSSLGVGCVFHPWLK